MALLVSNKNKFGHFSHFGSKRFKAMLIDIFTLYRIRADVHPRRHRHHNPRAILREQIERRKWAGTEHTHMR